MKDRFKYYLKEKEIYNRPFEPNPFLEVPLHPADAGRRALDLIKSPKQTVQQLPPEKKLKGYDKYDPKPNDGQCQSSFLEFERKVSQQ